MRNYVISILFRVFCRGLNYSENDSNLSKEPHSFASSLKIHVQNIFHTIPSSIFILAPLWDIISKQCTCQRDIEMLVQQVSLKAGKHRPRGWGGGSTSSGLRGLPTPSCWVLPIWVLPVGFDTVDQGVVPLLTLLFLALPLSLTTLSENFLLPSNCISVASAIPSLSCPLSKAAGGSRESTSLGFRQKWSCVPNVWLASCVSRVINFTSLCFSFCLCVKAIMMLIELVHHLRVWDTV